MDREYTHEEMLKGRDEPEAGVADAMALAARSEDFATDTIEAYEALSQRVKALEERVEHVYDALLDYFEGRQKDLQSEIGYLEENKP